MKIVLFFIAMIMCGINFAEAEMLTNMTCTDEHGTSHTIKIDRDDLYTLVVDDTAYDFVKDSVVGDINLSRYQSHSNPSALAFLNVQMYEDDHSEYSETKLVLLRDGDKEAQFGALCADNE